jgi:restriction system protein
MLYFRMLGEIDQNQNKMKFDFEREYYQNFIGREKELEWLDERLFRRGNSFFPIVVSGLGGIGKSTLVRQWFSSRRISYNPLWLDLSLNIEDDAIDNLLIEIRKISDERDENGYRGLTVVVDGTDIWSQKKHEETASKIFNFKIVESLIFIRRNELELKRAQHLSIQPLSNSATGDLLKKLLSSELSEKQISDAIEASKGFPLALSILSKLIKGSNVDSILSSNEPLYDIQNGILVPKNQIIASTKPIIIDANNKLIESLKKQPVGIRNLTPREFEELLADLLSDMGWDVELTKQTRDGGADILAYLNTDVGRLLCLVEAKHYREDRKIGVDLVRTLYGTLCDAQANSAMLVTSSSFTSGAKEFQQKHEYQLTLREYADVIEWIMKFGNKKNNFT